MRTFLSLCFLLVLLSACQRKKQYYTLTGVNHTTFQIKYQYDRALDGVIEAEFKRYYHSINPFDSTSISLFIRTVAETTGRSTRLE